MGLFKKKLKQEHKVMLQAERAAGALLPEYHRATPECPEPERWSMYDSMTAEVEVLEFLATLVTTVKPELMVETGAFLGVCDGVDGAGAGAQWLRVEIVSCEFDPVVFEKAKAEDCGLRAWRQWIELRNESSLEMQVPGTIDLLFSATAIWRFASRRCGGICRRCGRRG